MTLNWWFYQPIKTFILKNTFYPKQSCHHYLYYFSIFIFMIDNVSFIWQWVALLVVIIVGIWYDGYVRIMVCCGVVGVGIVRMIKCSICCLSIIIVCGYCYSCSCCYCYCYNYWNYYCYLLISCLFYSPLCCYFCLYW